MDAQGIAQALRVAIGHHQSGRWAEAEAIYRQVLAHQPDQFDALHLLGVMARQAGKSDVAVELIARAIQINPAFAEAHSNLANALRDQGKLDAAVEAGLTAIRLKPDFLDAWLNLSNALADLGRLDEAVAACRQALRIKPGFAEAYLNLGNCLTQAGQIDRAVAAFEQAIRLKPGFAEAHFNLANALREQCRLQEAMGAYRRALQLNPGYVEAHWNYGLACLLHGDFEHGWIEHEWRWKRKGGVFIPPNFSQPQWAGEDLNGRTLLLHAEQGFGDSIQFLRFVPLVAARGGKIFLECQRELRRLFKHLPGVRQIISGGEPLPEFELHCSLMSLPLALGIRLESIPAEAPYLRADPILIEQWRSRFRSAGNDLKVGLAWAGSRTHQNDRNRSIDPKGLGGLAKLNGVKFYNLQKDRPAPADLNLIDYTDNLRDFADTAAMLSHLDLVITVDTAVAHLAGAMGKPVWILLPYSPDWRWLLHRNDSPWYPSAHLFRQEKSGDWPAVFDRVEEHLARQACRAGETRWRNRTVA